MMPVWYAGSGAPWGCFTWIAPLIALVFMAVMVFVCFRVMRGCMAGPTFRMDGETERLNAEVRELREEIRMLWKQS